MKMVSAMKRAFLLCSIPTTAFLLLGCTPNALTPNENQCPGWNDNVDPMNAQEPPNTTPATRKVDVAACAGGLSQAEIDAELELTKEIEQDFGEQRACGILLRNYSYSLSHFFAAAACGIPTYPEGFAYNGSGYYLVGSVMGVQAKLAKDTSFGKKGDDLPFDVFDQLSYSSGSIIFKATIVADTTWSTNDPTDLNIRLKGTLDISFEGETKPDGLELWGIPTDGKPTQKQQEELAKAIGESVSFTSEANVATLSPGGNVSYTFSSTEATVDATYNNVPLGLTLINITATNDALMQKATLVHYGVTFLPQPHGPLSGSLIMKVEGGKFPYYVKYSYPNRVAADVEISCTEPMP